MSNWIQRLLSGNNENDEDPESVAIEKHEIKQRERKERRTIKKTVKKTPQSNTIVPKQERKMPSFIMYNPCYINGRAC